MGAHCVKAHGPVNILEFSFPKVLEAEIRLSMDLFEGTRRQKDIARLALILNTRRDIDAITKNVVAVDNDLANIDSNSECDLQGSVAIALSHLSLQRHCAGHRVDHAGE